MAAVGEVRGKVWERQSERELEDHVGFYHLIFSFYQFVKILSATLMDTCH